MPPEVVPWVIVWFVLMVVFGAELLATRREEHIGYVIRMAPWRWPLSFAWRFCSCVSCTVQRKIIETTHKEAIARRTELARKAPPKPDYSIPMPFPPITPSHLVRRTLWSGFRPVGVNGVRPRQLSEEEKMIIARTHSRSEAEAILLEDMRQTTGVCDRCFSIQRPSSPPCVCSSLPDPPQSTWMYKTTYTYQKPK